MSEIEKYKKYLNFKANPRYLTRDFIVPLYTGTEPDIYEDKKPNMNDPGMVVDPSKILPKNFTDDMPFVTDENNLEQLELADGGSVERRGFAPGGIANTTEFAKQQRFFKPSGFQRVLITKNSPLHKVTMKALFEAGIDFGKGTGTTTKDNPSVRIFKNATEKNINKFNNIMKEKAKRLGIRSRFEVEEEGKLIKDFVLNKIKNKESITLNTIYEKFPSTDRGLIIKALPENIYKQIDVVGPKRAAGLETLKKLNIGKIQNQIDAGKYITKQIVNNEEILKKDLSKIMNIRVGEVEQKMNNLISNLYRANQRSSAKGGRGDFLKNNFSYDERNNIIQALFNSNEFKSLYHNRLRSEINMALPENSNLREEALKKLNNFIKVKTQIEKKFGDVTELEHPLARNIIASAERNPGQSFLRVTPVPKQFNRYKTYFDNERGKIQRKILDAIDKGENTTDLVNELKAKEKAVQTLFGDYDIGKVSSKGGIIRYGTKSFFENDLNQLLKDNLKLVDNLKNNISLNKQNLISLFEEAKLNVSTLQKGLELRSPNVTTTDIDDIINKIENVKTKSAIDIADELSKEDARAVCGKLNLGGLPKGCAELAKEDPEKFLKTVAETTKDTSLATKANQAFNFTKKIVSAADEVILLGKGVAGRTVAPLAILNSALEQFTAGNYREAYRQAFDFLDPLPLVGIDVFEKYRREGSIENIRSRIGKENQESFNRILEFKPEFDKLTDVNTKLERAESAAQNPYDAESPGVDPMYINDLKKQQADLNKIVNSSKYQNIRNDIENVGKALQKETYSRNLGKPEKEKVAYDTANLETFSRVIGSDFLNQLSDETKTFTPNLTAAEKIREKERELPPMSDEQRIIIEEMGARGGAADGGRIELGEGGGPKIGRRGFLGLIAGAAAAPDLIKAIKGTGQAGKIASKIKFEKTEGMYPWFPDLVEKIKTKGKPFEEKEIIMEASYKHEPKGYGGLPKGVETVTRHVDGDTEFLLREYPDGRIAVDIHSPRNQEGSSTPVTLYYRPTMELKYYSGVKVEPAEFKVLEKEPRYFANGPDDVDIEMSETRKIPGKNTIYGDVEAAERFATGKIENRKIIPAKQARREQMEDAPTDFIEETSPYGPVYD